MEQREIKFRTYEPVHGMQEPWKLEDMTSFELEPGSRVYSRKWMDGIIFMQYTGLKDKNGKEIYEGDYILRNGHLRFVVFNESAFMSLPIKHWTKEADIDWIIALHNGWFLANFKENLEIIGNIYENPELLTPSPNE